MDSSQLCQKHAEERSEQPFASDAGVVHKLEVLSYMVAPGLPSTHFLMTGR
jgi:hypothetical protein